MSRECGYIMKILYAVSPIGLGHAARSVAIALELKKFGYEITFASDNKVCRFLKEYGFPCIVVHDKVPYFSISKEGKLRRITFWMINYVRFYKRMKKKADKFVRNWNTVISDEEFAFGVKALEYGRKLVFISDLIETHFSRNRFSKWIEEKTNQWFLEFYKKVPLLIAVEETSLSLPNIKEIYPIVRKTYKDREEIRNEINADSFDKVILITSGGGAAGNFIYKFAMKALSELDLHDVLVVIVGSKKRDKNTRFPTRYYEFYRDLHELVYASDLVITTAGKTTIDECLVYGTPFIAIPIKDHYEQERNAIKYGFKYEDLLRLNELIPGKLYGNKPTKINNRLDIAVKEINSFLIDQNI